MMKRYQFWLVIGTQHLYGSDIFETIEQRGKTMAKTLSKAVQPFAEVSFKTLLKTSDEIEALFKEANHNDEVAGVITWMHTFSPSKMWIRGLKQMQKPMLHLHTQFNETIPWDEIDMDFMNLNQAAHGDREHGHIHTRMKTARKVVSGYYKDESVLEKIRKWTRSAAGVLESKHLNIIRIGDNMRNVAVTEGDKVSAEMMFGWSVNTFGSGEIANRVKAVTQNELREQMDKYKKRYEIDTENIEAVEYQAKLQIAIRHLLREHGAKGFTTTFEDLHGLRQLPGLAAQDLMAEGYGFAAEGDWKTSALLRIIKLMANGGGKGSSFMEDYTYHFENGEGYVLGSHMLEICPSIASNKPKIKVEPLGIGGKEDPARAVFEAKEGKAVQVSIVDLGGRFRMIVSDCEALTPFKSMPNLPVAAAMWKLKPNFSTATESWIHAGGAHHTVMSYDLDAEVLRNFAEMMDIEFVHINQDTDVNTLKQTMNMQDVYYRLKGFGQ